MLDPDHGRVAVETDMAIGADSVAAGLSASRVQRVTEYIEQNLDKPLLLTELCAVVYMSPFHFARLFRNSTGEPPHRFVTRRRIVRASELLARPELTIAEISWRVGFRTPSHFTTVFRRVSGVSPSAYRIEHAGERSLATTEAPRSQAAPPAVYDS